jgi:hypothetical protein
MQHQILNVRIFDNICSVNYEMCKFNSTDICLSCIIMSGNIKFPVKFVPGLKIPRPQPDQIDDQKKIVIKLPPQEAKDTLPNSEDGDMPHFVDFISPEIMHSHSTNMRFHRHYLINYGNFGTRCYICFTEIMGSTICKNCEIIFE